MDETREMRAKKLFDVLQEWKMKSIVTEFPHFFNFSGLLVCNAFENFTSILPLTFSKVIKKI